MNIEAKTKLYAQQANKGRRELIFNKGDQVWVHLRKERFPAERKSKLMPRIHGPFTVVKRINNNAYELDLQGKYNISSSFNVSDLSPFIADETDLRSNLLEEGEDDTILVKTEPNSMDEEHMDEDILRVPAGAMTRSRTKLFNQAVGGLVVRIQSQEADNPSPTTLVLTCSQQMGV
jgi:hypothetical protein